MFGIVLLLITPLFTTISLGFPKEDLPILGIVGGNKAKEKQFPHQISFQYNYGHKCGGSIIAPKYILTAAHCTEGRHAEQIAIRAGTLDREVDGQLINVKNYINHPSYDNKTFDYDLSVMELESPLELNAHVKPIALPKDNEKITVTSATASGWGQEAEDNPMLPRHLKYTELPIWKHEDCKKQMDASDRMLCAGYPHGGQDTCQSDSGGPLIAKGKLIGVVSWGYGCGRPNSPGIFTNVAMLRGWIKETVNV